MEHYVKNAQVKDVTFDALEFCNKTAKFS